MYKPSTFIECVTQVTLNICENSDGVVLILERPCNHVGYLRHTLCVDAHAPKVVKNAVVAWQDVAELLDSW